MFSECFGYPVLDKSWLALVEKVRSSKLGDQTNLVQVLKGNLYATDGHQIVKIDVSGFDEITTGIYVMAKDGYLFECKESSAFPDGTKILNKENRDKAALVYHFDTNPLVATASIIAKFGFVINLDLHKDTILAAAKLQPETVRVYGYEDSSKNENSPVIIEFIDGAGNSFDLALVGISGETFIDDDEAPLFKRDAA